MQRNLLPFLEAQAKSLGEYGEDQYRLGHGEGRDDAHAGTAAEGQVSEARALLARLLGKTRRVEALRIIPETAVAIQYSRRY